LTIWQKMV
jgi:chemotaxis family two-component system response regulator Rcp1